MKSRALRAILLVLFVGLIGGTAYVVWTEEAEGRAGIAAARAFDERARTLSRELLEIRSAQAGYVAAGQGEDFWAARVDSLLASARNHLSALEAQARSAAAREQIAAAASSVRELSQLDDRARAHARSGQRLLASDVVFADALQRIGRALDAVDEARTLELVTRDAGMSERRRTQLIALGGAAALALVIVFALGPLPRDEIQPPAAASGSLSPRDAAVPPPAPAHPSLVVPARDSDLPLSHTPGEKPPPQEPQPAVADAAPPPTERMPPPPVVDLPGVASLCADLSRIVDTGALPEALARAATLLDASGLVIWIADPDGRELAPIVAHGYPESLLARLGTIERDADNVTAAAFRTGLVQTVDGQDGAHGAIAAPLLSPAGPVGVMAAEVRHGGEQQEGTRAVATIVAAQLATLMGPPTSRSKNETAGAQA